MRILSPFLWLSLSSLLLPAFGIASQHHYMARDENGQVNATSDESDHISKDVRIYWMRRAQTALLELTGTPCPFGAFGTAIVNHTASTSDGLGELICIGANQVAEVGNPTLHGEIAAINNCTAVLSSPPYNPSPTEILAAWKDLTLYTTAESCPMCAAAVSWASFREYIYATRYQTLIKLGWSQIDISSHEVISRGPQRDKIRILGGVLEEETDQLFGWQFRDGPCPSGCVKATGENAKCVAQE